MIAVGFLRNIPSPEHGASINILSKNSGSFLANWAGLEILEVTKDDSPDSIWKLTTLIFKKMKKEVKFNDFVLTTHKTRRGPILTDNLKLIFKKYDNELQTSKRLYEVKKGLDNTHADAPEGSVK